MADLILTAGLGLDEIQVGRTLNNLGARAGRAMTQGIVSAQNQWVPALGRITGKANEFQKSLEASNARVLAFGASAGAIYALRSAFDKLVDSTIDVEKSLTDINIALGMSQRDLANFSNRLMSVANSTSSTFKEATQAALEFSRHGLNVEQTLKRTQAALALSKLSGMDYMETVKSLTATMNSFTKESLDEEDVLNRLIAVGSKFAASAGDLSEGLSRVAAVANDANVSLNQTLALIAAAQQVTARGGSVIGNSFKSIFTRLQRPEVLNDLEQAGIAVRDLNGKVRPLIDILRSLSSTYNSLGQAQKSFVSETVGGVYQVNVLKAILTDLGGGADIFGRALDTAGKSAGSAEKRLKELNGTISSSLIRTMNELTRASANVGESLLGGTMRGGISGFDQILKKIGDAFDKSASGDGKFANIGANMIQGIARGASNIISGPVLQGAVMLFLKTFERLQKFAVDAVKDMKGIAEKARERAEIEKSIGSFLMSQEGMLDKLIRGQITLNQVAKEHLRILGEQNSQMAIVNAYSKAIAGINAPMLSVKRPNAAGGYIPSMAETATEVSKARNAGYGISPSDVVLTTVHDGDKKMQVVANRKETMSTVFMGGKQYDFINPPAWSAAGKAHALKSPMAYLGSQRPVCATGFAPNLALSPETLAKLKTSGIVIEGAGGVLDKSQSRIEHMNALPDDVVNGFLNAFSGDKEQLFYAMKVATRRQRQKGMPAIFTKTGEQNKDFWDWARGAFPENKEGVSAIISKMTGINYGADRAAADMAKLTKLDPRDVQNALTNFGPDFGFIYGYESPSRMVTPKDDPRAFAMLQAGGTTYKVPTPRYGHQTAVSTALPAYKEALKLATGMMGVKNPRDMDPSQFGHAFGAWFEDAIAQHLEQFGLKRSEGNNANLDFMGWVPQISEFINRKKPLAGFDVKASVANASNVPEKIFRALAGEPGVGSLPFDLSGPKGIVPPFVNIGKFSGQGGSIGLLDKDAFLKSGQTSANEFNALVYAAAASGRPLKINYGPMASGKTTVARNLMAANKGSREILSRDDLDKVEQFVFTTTATKDILSGVSGFAMAASSDIEAFLPTRKEMILENLKKRAASDSFRAKEGENADAIYRDITSEAKWGKYNENVFSLAKMFGGRFHHHEYADGYAEGFTPKMLEEYLNQKQMVGAKLDISKRNVEQIQAARAVAQKFGLDPRSLLMDETFRDSFRGMVGFAADGMNPTSDRFWQNMRSFKVRKNYKEYPSARRMSFDDTGSYLEYYHKDDTIGVDFIRGEKKGDAFRMWKALTRLARRTGKAITSNTLVGQRRNMVNVDPKASNWERLLAYYPQLKYRQMDKFVTSGFFSSLESDAENREYINFQNLEQLKEHVNKLPRKHVEDKYLGHSTVGDLMTRYVAALGYVPDLFGGNFDKMFDVMSQHRGSSMAALDALSRENRATGGHGMLTTEPALATAENPFGVVAIDKRTQPNAKVAIAQHRMMGQTMSQIKSAHSAGGFAPNLALDPLGGSAGNAVLTSLAMGIFGYASQRVGTSEWLEKLKMSVQGLTTENERQILTIKAGIKEFANLKTAFLLGERGPKNPATFTNPVTGVKGTYKSVAELESAFPHGMVKGAENLVKQYQDDKLASAQRMERRGMMASLIAGGGAGILAQLASMSSPRLGAAVQETGTGIMGAGQALMAFPNRFGATLGGGMAISAVLGGIDTFTKGLANSQMEFDALLSKTQTVTSNLDAVAASLASLDNLVNDSNVSFESLVREQRKLTELIGKLGAKPEGAEIATRLMSAHDNKSRMAAIEEYKDKLIRERDVAGGELDAEKYTSGRRFLGIRFQNPFSYSNEAEKLESNEAISNRATALITSLSNPFKKSFFENPDAFKDNASFVKALNGGGPDVQSQLKRMQQKLGAQGFDTIMSQTRVQLGEEAAINSPEGKAALARTQGGHFENQLKLDNAIRNASTQRRLFINMGANASGNTIDLAGIANRATYGEAVTRLTQQQGLSQNYQMMYGERSNRTFAASLETQRLEAENQFKVKGIRQETSRGIVGQLSQNFDQFMGSNNLMKMMSVGGMSFATIGDAQARFVNALNKGLSRVTDLSGGDIVSKFSKNGAFDYESFANKVSTMGGGGDAGVQNALLQYLRNNYSEEILKTIQNGNKEIVAANQETKTETSRVSETLKTELAGIDFKTLSSFMGGMRSLFDRGYRRSSERQAIRGMDLAFNAHNVEGRGFGAASFLGWMKENNIPIQPDKNPLVARLWNIAKEGKIAVDQKSIGNMSGALSRMGIPASAQKSISAIFGRDSASARAEASMMAEFRPESSALTNGPTSQINQSVSALDKAVNDCTSIFNKFGDNLVTTMAKMGQTQAARVEVQKAVDEANGKSNQVLEQILEAVRNRFTNNGPSPISPEGSAGRETFTNWATVAQVGGSLATAAAGAGVYGLLRKRKKTPLTISYDDLIEAAETAKGNGYAGNGRNGGNGGGNGKFGSNGRTSAGVLGKAVEAFESEEAARNYVTRTTTVSPAASRGKLFSSRLGGFFGGKKKMTWEEFVASSQGEGSPDSIVSNASVAADRNTEFNKIFAKKQGVNNPEHTVRYNEKTGKLELKTGSGRRYRPLTDYANELSTGKFAINGLDLKGMDKKSVIKTIENESRSYWTPEMLAQEAADQAAAKKQHTYYSNPKNAETVAREHAKVSAEYERMKAGKTHPKVLAIYEKNISNLEGELEKFGEYKQNRSYVPSLRRSGPTKPIPVAEIPESRRNYGKTAPVTAGAPVMGFAGGFGGGFGGGMSPMGGMGQAMLGMGVSQLMYASGAHMGGFKGGALMLGSSFAPELVSGLGRSALGVRAIMGAGSLGGGGLLAGGAAGIAGTGVLAAGVGYGAYRGTIAIRNKLTGIDKLAEDLDKSNVAGGVGDYIKKGLARGKSSKDMENYVQSVINTTEGQLKTTKMGVFSGGWLGLGSQADTLKQTLADLKELKSSIAGAKEEYDQQHKAEQQQDALIKALEKLASGGGGAATMNSNINVVISLKDVEKGGDAVKKVVDQIQQQLATMQTKLATVSVAAGMTPEPAQANPS